MDAKTLCLLITAILITSSPIDGKVNKEFIKELTPILEDLKVEFEQKIWPDAKPPYTTIDFDPLKLANDKGTCKISLTELVYPYHITYLPYRGKIKQRDYPLYTISLETTGGTFYLAGNCEICRQGEDRVCQEYESIKAKVSVSFYSEIAFENGPIKKFVSTCGLKLVFAELTVEKPARMSKIHQKSFKRNLNGSLTEYFCHAYNEGVKAINLYNNAR